MILRFRNARIPVTTWTTGVILVHPQENKDQRRASRETPALACAHKKSYVLFGEFY